MTNFIRFDWAMKRLLRNKANYAVFQGLHEPHDIPLIPLHRLPA